MEKPLLLIPNPGCCQIQKMGSPSPTARCLCIYEEREEESAEEHQKTVSRLDATSEHNPCNPKSVELAEKDRPTLATKKPSDSTAVAASETNPREQTTPVTSCGPAAAATS